MPYKSAEAKRIYNRHFHRNRYIADPEFREKKRKKTAEWRAKIENYYEYMKPFMKRAKKRAIWLKYRTV